MKKLQALLLAALLALLPLTGCKNDKGTVYFLNFKPESAGVYNQIVKAYEKETGVKVKVVTAAANTYEQTLKSEIAKKNAPTIFQVNGPIGYKSWAKYCEKLNDSKLYSYLSDKSLAIKDKENVYAIPYVMEGYGIIYNEELTDKYFSLNGRNNNYSSMEEINNFSAFKTICEDMTAKKDALGIDGVFASTSLSSGEDWRWQTHLLNIPLYYEFSKNDDYPDPTLAGLNAKKIDFRYGENFKNIFDLYTDNSVTEKKLLGSKSVEDSMAEFAQRKVVFVQNGNWAWSQINNVSGNKVKKDKVKFLPVYMGIDGEEEQGLCIGTENYLAINKNASEESKKASLDFLDWLFSSKTGKRYVTKELNFITPFNTFTEKELPSDPLAKEVIRYLNDSEKKTIPFVFASFPNETFKSDVGSALLSYVQGDIDYEQVAKSIADSWKRERK